MVQELIDSGELGELYFVSSSRVNLGLHQRDISVVWDLGPHDFSILLLLAWERLRSGSAPLAATRSCPVSRMWPS